MGESEWNWQWGQRWEGRAKAASQGARVAGQTGEVWDCISLRAPERAQPRQHLDFNSGPPPRRVSPCCLEPVVVTCYSSHTHTLPKTRSSVHSCRPRPVLPSLIFFNVCLGPILPSLKNTRIYVINQKPWWLSGRDSACSAGDADSILGLGRSPGGGNGNPLQYSCLENPMGRETWLATV